MGLFKMSLKDQTYSLAPKMNNKLLTEGGRGFRYGKIPIKSLFFPREPSSDIEPFITGGVCRDKSWLPFLFITQLKSHSCSSLNSPSTSFHQSATHPPRLVSMKVWKLDFPRSSTWSKVPTTTCFNETLRIRISSVKHLDHSGRKANPIHIGYWNFKCSPILQIS